MVRFADDFVVVCKTKEQAMSMYERLKPYLTYDYCIFITLFLRTIWGNIRILVDLRIKYSKRPEILFN